MKKNKNLKKALQQLFDNKVPDWKFQKFLQPIHILHAIKNININEYDIRRTLPSSPNTNTKENWKLIKLYNARNQEEKIISSSIRADTLCHN